MNETPRAAYWPGLRQNHLEGTMTTPAPPLTEAELTDAATWEEHVARGECTCERLCRWRCALHGSPDYKSHAPSCGCSGCYASNKEHHSRLKAEAALKPRIASLESELAQLRREKAEREGLERRRDEWLTAADGREMIHSIGPKSGHTIWLSEFGRHTGRNGPTYEAALAAALGKVEAK